MPSQEVQSKALGAILSNAFSKFACDSGGHDRNGSGQRRSIQQDTLLHEQQQQVQQRTLPIRHQQQAQLQLDDEERITHPGQGDSSHKAAGVEDPTGHCFGPHDLAHTSHSRDSNQPMPPAVPISRRSSGGFDPVAAANELERRYKENLLLAEEQEKAAALAADDLSSLD